MAQTHTDGVFKKKYFVWSWHWQPLHGEWDSQTGQSVALQMERGISVACILAMVSSAASRKSSQILFCSVHKFQLAHGPIWPLQLLAILTTHKISPNCLPYVQKAGLHNYFCICCNRLYWLFTNTLSMYNLVCSVAGNMQGNLWKGQIIHSGF